MEETMQTILQEYQFWKKSIVVLRGDLEELEQELHQVPAVGVSSMDASGVHSVAVKQSQEEAILLHTEQIQKEIQHKKLALMRLEHRVHSVERAIAVLSKTDRDIITRRYIEGMTWENTAMWVQASVGYCRKHAKQALENLARVYIA